LNGFGDPARVVALVDEPELHAGYYAAFVLDPDGNNIEVVNHHRITI
jgi:catechol 2,3-dioxygenase-like lactoylglutathione lyase family enzyme